MKAVQSDVMTENDFCPFCGYGTRAEETSLIVESYDASPAIRLPFTIYCLNCFANGPACETAPEALEKWRTRADVAKLSGTLS